MRASLIKWFNSAFCDHSGQASSMRILSFIVCVLVLGLWVCFCFVEGRYIPLGWAEAGLIGAACGAKAAQSRFEIGSGGIWNNSAKWSEPEQADGQAEDAQNVGQ